MFGTSFHCFPATSEGPCLSHLVGVNKQCRRLVITQEKGEAGMSKSRRVWDTWGCSSDKHTTWRRCLQLCPCIEDVLFPACARAGLKAAGQEMPCCSFSLPSPAHEFFCSQPHLPWADKICVAGGWVCSWVSSGRDFSGWYQWKQTYGHNKGRYQPFSSLLKARWHLCNYLQLSSTLPTVEKSKRNFWSACPWAIAPCTLTDRSLTLGLSLPLCGISPGASSSFKLALLVILHCFFESMAVCHLPGPQCFQIDWEYGKKDDSWDCRTDHERYPERGIWSELNSLLKGCCYYRQIQVHISNSYHRNRIKASFIKSLTPCSTQAHLLPVSTWAIANSGTAHAVSAVCVTSDYGGDWNTGVAARTEIVPVIVFMEMSESVDPRMNILGSNCVSVRKCYSRHNEGQSEFPNGCMFRAFFFWSTGIFKLLANSTHELLICTDCVT